MDRTRVGFATLGVVGVLLAVWASLGPFFFETCCHPVVTPARQAWSLAGNLLWVAVMLVAFRRSPAGPMWKLVLFSGCRGDVGGRVHRPGADVDDYPVLRHPRRRSPGAHGAGFPTGWLMGRFDRVFVGANYISALLFQAAWLFFWDPEFPDASFA